MPDHSPRPSSGRLRWGLHTLVLTLASVVLLRAALLSQPRTGPIAVLVTAFALAYVVREQVASPRTRGVLLAAMVTIWASLTVLGADAAYISVGLFLVFLIDLRVTQALACVLAMTVFDVVVSAAHGDPVALLAAPVLGAVISVLLGLGYRLLFDMLSRQQDLIDELHLTRSELARSERTAGQAAERQRLAREIHDAVAQSLSSIQMLLHAADGSDVPPRSRERISMARETAAAALSETRHIMDELGPADLVDSTLASALAQVCSRAIAPVRLDVDGAPVALAPSVEAALVRIAQGAVGNVDRHAGSQARAVVSLSWGVDAVRLDVVDDGVGFDPTTLTAGRNRAFGLTTMRARVRDLGGEFSVESEAGHTALSATFPIPAMSGPAAAPAGVPA